MERYPLQICLGTERRFRHRNKPIIWGTIYNLGILKLRTPLIFHRTKLRYYLNNHVLRIKYFSAVRHMQTGLVPLLFKYSILFSLLYFYFFFNVYDFYIETYTSLSIPLIFLDKDWFKPTPISHLDWSFITIISLGFSFILLCCFFVDPSFHTVYKFSSGISLDFYFSSLSTWFFFLSNLILFVIGNSYKNQTWSSSFYSICLVFVFFSSNFLVFFIAVELLVLPTILMSSLRYINSTFPKAVQLLLIFSFITMLIFLLSILLIFYIYGSFDLLIILNNVHNSPEIVHFYSFYIMLFGLSIKLALFPLHIWLPKAHVDGDTEMSLILASILLKCLFFGLFRFCFLPFSLGINMLFFRYVCYIGMLVPIFVCFRDFNLKRIIAYNSISHMSVGCLTLSYFNSLVLDYQLILLISSGFIVMVSHSFVASLLFLLVGFLQNIYKTKHFFSFSFGSSSFLIGVIFLLSFLDNGGCLPLTISFMAEFNILILMFHLGLFFDLFIILIYLFFSCVLTFYVLLRIRSSVAKNINTNQSVDFGKIYGSDIIFILSIYFIFSFFLFGMTELSLKGTLTSASFLLIYFNFLI